MKSLFLSLILGLFFIGCATPPTPQQVESADYGREIGQDEAENAVKEWMEYRLKDPSSAQYKFTIIHKGYFQDGIALGGAIYYGYLTEVEINGKNSYGGYTGFTSYKFLLKNGKVYKALKKHKEHDVYLPFN